MEGPCAAIVNLLEKPTNRHFRAEAASRKSDPVQHIVERNLQYVQIQNENVKKQWPLDAYLYF